MKSNHKNFVHLVGLYTYCKMMHGAYSVEKVHILVKFERVFFKYFCQKCETDLRMSIPIKRVSRFSCIPRTHQLCLILAVSDVVDLPGEYVSIILVNDGIRERDIVRL